MQEDIDAAVEADRQAAIMSELQVMDRDVPRGLEDLIDTLVSKNIIKNDDLPTELQDKLTAKKNKRLKL